MCCAKRSWMLSSINITTANTTSIAALPTVHLNHQREGGRTPPQTHELHTTGIKAGFQDIVASSSHIIMLHQSTNLSIHKDVVLMSQPAVVAFLATQVKFPGHVSPSSKDISRTFPYLDTFSSLQIHFPVQVPPFRDLIIISWSGRSH